MELIPIHRFVLQELKIRGELWLMERRTMERTSVANLETKDSLDDSDYLVVDDLTTTKKILARQFVYIL